MNAHRILIVAAVLLAIPALASAATPIAVPLPEAPAAGVTPVVTQDTAVPSLDAFLSTLRDPAAAPVAKASCGSNFCTQAQRDACTQQCLAHHHGPFVGLECCSDSCTTLCICGSVPVGC